MAKKVRALSVGAIEVLEALKTAGAGTAASLKEAGVTGLNSAHLTALVNRGFAVAEEVELEVMQVQKRKVKQYTITELGLKTETEEA